MADKVSISMKVEVNGRTANVSFGRPLHLSGDSRRHRKQLRDIADEGITSLLAVLGGQFESEVE